MWHCEPLAQLYLKKVVVTSGVARIWCQGHDDWGTKVAEWSGVWGGVSAPQPTRRSGGASWAPPAGSGAEPRPLSHFLHILGHRTLLIARKILWNLELQEKLQIPLWSSGGDSHHHFQKWWWKVMIDSSHTKFRLCCELLYPYTLLYFTQLIYLLLFFHRRRTSVIAAERRFCNKDTYLLTTVFPVIISFFLCFVLYAVPLHVRFYDRYFYTCVVDISLLWPHWKCVQCGLTN